MRYVAHLPIAAVLFTTPLFAQGNINPQAVPEQQDISALEQKIRDLEDQVTALEAQVPQIKEPQDGAPAALGGAGGSAAKASQSGYRRDRKLHRNRRTQSRAAFAFTGNARNRSQPAGDSRSLRARGFLSFLRGRGCRPGGGIHHVYVVARRFCRTKAGKMRSAFGKVNMMHNHALPWIDRPLGNDNLVGGEDGINDAGFSVQRILPAPKGIFLEATGQLFRGDSEDVFTASSKNDVSMVAHLRGYKDITESTNLDLGVSYARGHNDLGSDFLTHLYGMDATLRWKPLRRSIYHSFVLRSEFVWSQRQQLSAEQRAFGFYASADYQLGRRWFLGGRYDQSDRSRFADTTDKGGSLVLTYWPSEFSQIRGQYRFTRYAGDIDSHELLLQVHVFAGGTRGPPF